MARSTDPTPLLLLVPGFPENESDSSCLPALQSYVEALGHRLPPAAVEVIAFQYPFTRRSYQWGSVRVHALGGGNNRFAKPHTWLRAVHTGRRVVAGRKCGIIHSFWLGECALIGSLLARRYGWKHVVSIGGQEVRRKSTYGRLLRHAPFSLTAGSIPAAEAVRRSVHRNVDAVIPLGLDADRIVTAAQDSSADRRPIDVLVVGSLIPVKRVDEAIDVAAQLVRLRPGLSLEIIGEGPERTRLQERIGNAGLDDHIVFRGRLPREEVLRLMQRSRVLLHPSEYESQGYVFLEALASGMYVVCRNVGFHPESPNVDHAESVDEMATVVAQRLARPHRPKPVALPTADQTVDAFTALYNA